MKQVCLWRVAASWCVERPPIFFSQRVLSEATADSNAVSFISWLYSYLLLDPLVGVSRAYVLGAMHDGTIRRRTIRISQREEAYVPFLRDLILRLGRRAWTYREGRSRHVYVVEFSRSLFDDVELRTRKDSIDYIRGYFDAEGGLPRSDTADPYSTLHRKIEKTWMPSTTSSAR